MSHNLYFDIREKVSSCAKEMAIKGLANGTSGNVSARTEDNNIAITATGVPYETMTKQDVCVVDFNGQSVAGTLRPSSELPMHTAVYRLRSDVKAIVHTHSLYATAFAVAGKPISAVHYVIATMGDEIPVIPYRVYGSDELASAVGAVLEQQMGLLLGNHGVLALGYDVQQALYHAEMIEYLAQLQLLAEQIATPNILSPAALNEVRQKFQGYGQK